MQIHLSDDGVPLYQQVVQQIRHRILSGQLSGGDEMPAIRTLAERLRVNPNTIARAYRELEQAGLVEKRRTRGTFVSSSPTSMSAKAKREAIEPAIDQLLVLSQGLGVDAKELSQWILRRDEELQRKRGETS
ncbi:GntR family transcriptional regulator [Rhodopirellula sp. P2]|uniref:GntR family transcriptional regulator n=1 Tax=Rhodopirellula sp. P2 TaxID=2127060 RepID=UPI0023676B66|nr:GntR family transcriptional regulator [Rhodopirellula sp. P2]WDQ18171.1 GntR family transcriptional regulator [Rhodopirellula sp. P2]